jgi:hypothetical protein
VPSATAPKNMPPKPDAITSALPEVSSPHASASTAARTPPEDVVQVEEVRKADGDGHPPVHADGRDAIEPRGDCGRGGGAHA